MSFISYYRTCAIPKPEPRKKVKGRKQRAAAKVVKSVRAQCVARDGVCRFSNQPVLLLVLLGACQGKSEWAHLGEHRRAKTRGMAPDVRHTTAGSLMLCTRHHAAYDRHDFDILASGRGADAALVILTPDVDYHETFIPMEDR